MGTGDRPWQQLHQGARVGFRLIVVMATDRRYGAEARAPSIDMLLDLNQQLAALGYEFQRLEAVYGG